MASRKFTEYQEYDKLLKAIEAKMYEIMVHRFGQYVATCLIYYAPSFCTTKMEEIAQRDWLMEVPQNGGGVKRYTQYYAKYSLIFYLKFTN